MASERVEKLIERLRVKDKIGILFVCLGNICRSPAAEGVFKSIIAEGNDWHLWDVDSAGTAGYHVGELPDRRMRVHAARRGLTLDHHCRRVKSSDFDRFDIVVAMDKNNEYDLKHEASSPDAVEKIVQMSEFFSLATRYDYVPDPYYEGAEGFELVLDLLQDACRNLYNRLNS